MRRLCAFGPECPCNRNHLERCPTQLRCNRHRYACQRRRPGRQTESAWLYAGRMRPRPALSGMHEQSTAVTGVLVSSAVCVNAAAGERPLSVKQSTELAGQTFSFARPLSERTGEAGSDARAIDRANGRLGLGRAQGRVPLQAKRLGLAAQSLSAQAKGLGLCAGSYGRTDEGPWVVRRVECPNGRGMSRQSHS